MEAAVEEEGGEAHPISLSVDRIDGFAVHQTAIHCLDPVVFGLYPTSRKGCSLDPTMQAA